MLRGKNLELFIAIPQYNKTYVRDNIRNVLAGRLDKLAMFVCKKTILFHVNPDINCNRNYTRFTLV